MNEDMQEELKEIKNRINEFERKYSFLDDYKMICAILDKYNLTDIILTPEELNNNKSIYIRENKENEIHIYKENK